MSEKGKAEKQKFERMDEDELSFSQQVSIWGIISYFSKILPRISKNAKIN